MASFLLILLLVLSGAHGRSTNQVGIDLIKSFEGWFPDFYIDPVGIRTIGYGHACHVNDCDNLRALSAAGEWRTVTAPLSLQDGDDLLRGDLVSPFEECVESRVAVAISDDQFAALISFTFNVGCGAFGSSTLLRRVNEGASASLISDAFLMWVKGGGVTLPGLVRRREAEATLFNGGGFPGGGGGGGGGGDPDVGGACSSSDGSQHGVCLKTSDCTGTSITGRCPGDSTITCCLGHACSAVDMNDGTCRDFAECGGSAHAGKCPGGAEIQCCVESDPWMPKPVDSPTCIPYTDVTVTLPAEVYDLAYTSSITMKAHFGTVIWEDGVPSGDGGGGGGTTTTGGGGGGPTGGEACSVPDFGDGNCVDVSACDGVPTPGYCPGAASIQCCVAVPCSPPDAGSGLCKETAACAGETFSGHCPGDASIRCCVNPPTDAACVVEGVAGTCQLTSTCDRATVAGLCPGSADNQCCVDYHGKCCANGKSGTCVSEAACPGTRTAGLCPGPADVQCCTTPASGDCGASGFSAAAPQKVSGVEFAPQTGTYWPLAQPNAAERSPVCYKDVAGNVVQSPATPVAASYGCSTRMFLGYRSGGSRYHSGIDLYAPAGTEVRATESGTIVNAYPFFENVCCVVQQTDSGVVINYGEISCNYAVRVGQRVSAGQKIGVVGNLNCCHPMMHFETYKQYTTRNYPSYPPNVDWRTLNPTEYLLNLRESGL